MYFSPGRILCETHMCVHQTETAENSRFVFADMILLTVLYLPLGLDKGNNETREMKKIYISLRGDERVSATLGRAPRQSYLT